MPSSEPPIVKPGRAIKASQIKDLNATFFNLLQPGPDLGASHVGNNILLTKTEDAIIPASRGVPKWYKVVSIGADHMVCNSFNINNGATGTIEINVAKFYDLQRTPFDGTPGEPFEDGKTVSYTYTENWQRTATDGTISETQEVTKPFLVGGKIQAVKIATGVTVDGIAVGFMDTNGAARAWFRSV